MKSVTVVVKGLSPVLMHRYTAEAEAATQAKTRTVNIKTEDPREVAERSAYRDESGGLVLPTTMFVAAIRDAGNNHKQKGSRRSLKYVIGAAVFGPEEFAKLVDPETGKQLKQIEVDTRRVVIRATGGAVPRTRARVNSWGAVFQLEIAEDVLDLDTVRQLLGEAGQRQGVGDFRPGKFGPFGRFSIVKWDVMTERLARVG